MTRTRRYNRLYFVLFVVLLVMNHVSNHVSLRDEVSLCWIIHKLLVFCGCRVIYFVRPQQLPLSSPYLSPPSTLQRAHGVRAHVALLCLLRLKDVAERASQRCELFLSQREVLWGWWGSGGVWVYLGCLVFGVWCGVI